MKNLKYIFSFIWMSFVSVHLFAQHPTCTGALNQINIQFTENEEFSPPDPPNDTVDYRINTPRKLFWVHGLGGGRETWIKAANATTYGAPNHPDFKPRVVQNLLPEYNEITLRDAGIDLLTQIDNSIHDGEPAEETWNNYIIAHSQGGPVSREANRLMEIQANSLVNDSLFGGIVTFGSPHLGAQILNNIDPNGPDMLTDFAVKACKDLTAGPLAEKKSKIPWVLDIIAHKTINKIFTEIPALLCDTLVGKHGVPLIIQDQTADISRDYMVGSPAINQLNAHQTPIHKVAFYGVEEEPIIWRTGSSYSPNHQQKPNDFDYFDANPDEALLNSINDMHSWYIAQAQRMNIMASVYGVSHGVPCNWLGWIRNPYNCILYEAKYYKLIDARNAYKRGAQWFLKANEEYKAIVGMTKVKTSKTQFYCRCTNRTNGQVVSTPIGPPFDCDPNPEPNVFCTLESGQVVTISETESDGVVLASSAAGFQNARVAKCAGSNHAQMRNDLNTKERLTELYDGGHGSFFYLDKQ